MGKGLNVPREHASYTRQSKGGAEGGGAVGRKVRLMYIACCDPNKDRDVVKEVFLLEH